MNQNNFLKKYAQNTADGSQPSAPRTAQTAAAEPAAPALKKPVPASPTPEPSARANDSPQSFRAAPVESKSFYEQKSAFHAPQPIAAASVPEKSSAIRSAVIWSAIAAVIVIAAVMLFTVFGGKTTVPDFSTFTVSDVQLWCSQNGINLQKTEAYSETVAEKNIISQSVSAGEKLKKGDFLSVEVSLGLDLSIEVALPDLMSMTKAQVQSWADEHKLTKLRITAEASDSVPLGQVIRYEINDNTVIGNTVHRDTPIYVIVSKGSEAAADITVPNFKTMSMADIQAFGRENDVNLTVKEVYDDYVPAGTVITQSIEAEKRIPAGSILTVTLSKGRKVTVPDFSLLTQDAALAKAAALGIDVDVCDVYSQLSKASFVSQSVPQGTVYENGTVIQLCYSKGNLITINSFEGNYEYEVQEWLEEQNSQGADLSVIYTYTESSLPMGTVISQSSKNTRLKMGSFITVVLSRGMPVFVPSFVFDAGLNYNQIYTREKAVELCEELGLVPIFRENRATGRLPGEIISQSIRAGSEVAQGTNIILEYVPVDRTVHVPNLDGVPFYIAQRYGRQFDLEFVYLTEEVEGYADQVCKQSLRPDSTVAYGTKLVLHIAPIPEEESEPILP